VSRAKVARFRPVKLNPKPLEEAALWIGGYQKFWEATAGCARWRELARRRGDGPLRRSHRRPGFASAGVELDVGLAGMSWRRLPGSPSTTTTSGRSKAATGLGRVNE
jgi:hypothetical protein